MLQPVTLEGRHVRLEPLSLEHVPALAEASSGPRETFVYTLVPNGEAETRQFIEDALSMHAAGTAVPFATVDRATGRVVGTTRFCYVEFWDWPEGSPYQRGTDLPDALEIGYTWLAPQAQRTAINREAKLLMLTHAFEVWRVHRVRLVTDARNQGSRRAIERLGARFDGVLRAARTAFDGSIRDSACYSMLDSEWPVAKAALEARLRTG
jgi:RimJ/RimL family protein N-acetyltransferase